MKIKYICLLLLAVSLTFAQTGGKVGMSFLKIGVDARAAAMGEAYTSETWWRDPFAAYRIPKKEDAPPLPIRPVEGRALWREFRGLFLPHHANDKNLKALWQKKLKL